MPTIGCVLVGSIQKFQARTFCRKVICVYAISSLHRRSKLIAQCPGQAQGRDRSHQGVGRNPGKIECSQEKLASARSKDAELKKPPLPRIAAIRLEALPDESLPNRGPGRHPSGNFQLYALRLFTSRNSAGEPGDPVRIARAAASFQHAAADVNVVGTIDKTLGTMWHVWGRFGQAHQAFYGLDAPVATDTTTPLIFQLEQPSTLGLGRFRLSVSSDPNAFGIEARRLAAMKLLDPWKKLGVAYAIAGQKAPAVKYLSKALQHTGDPASRKALIELVHSNDELLADLTRRHPEDFQLQLALARSLSARGAKALTEKDALGGIAHLKEARDIYSRLLSAVAKWKVLSPIEMATDAGLKLELQNDGSIFVHEPKGNDTYSLVFQTDLKGIKGLRLETLADSRLAGSSVSCVGHTHRSRALKRTY